MKFLSGIRSIFYSIFEVFNFDCVDSDGFHRDLGLNGEKVGFECRTTSVAVRLTELMALAEKNNRPQVRPFRGFFNMAAARVVTLNFETSVTEPP